MIKAIVIIRTSTTQQEIEEQRAETVEYAKSYGYSEDEIKVIGQKGASAIKVDVAYQRNMNLVFQAIEENPIECVFAWMLDRIARNEEAFYKFKNFLIQHHVNLRIKNPSLFLMDENGEKNNAMEMAISMFITMATQEMEVKEKRFKRGRKTASEKGKRLAAQLKYGYAANSDGYVIINKEEATVIQTIFEMYASGKFSYKSLSKEVRERGYNFAPQRITRILTDTSYTGGFKGLQKYPQIIEKELFERCETVRKLNQTEISKASRHTVYLGNKKIKCLSCGSYFAAMQDEYVCTRHKFYNLFKDGIRCQEKGISRKVMDSIFTYVCKECHLPYITSLATRKTSEIQAEIKILGTKINVAEDNLNEIHGKNERLMMLYVDGKLNDSLFDKKTSEIQAEKENLSTKLKGFKEKKKELQQQIEMLKCPTLQDNKLLQESVIRLLREDNIQRLKEYVNTYIKVSHVVRIASRLILIYVIDYQNEIHCFIYSPIVGRPQANVTNVLEFMGNLDVINTIDWDEDETKEIKLSQGLQAALNKDTIQSIIKAHKEALQRIKEVDNIQ